jgi:TolB-like protein/class 3 adenylate cyclase/Tfp pilus assembly protein PilF
MERRLAAVLIADVVGYGRLSQVDEEGTRARFQADVHDIIAPRITEHHGRLVKTMGDGLLVEFRSVVDAVRCAIDIQRAKTERNADLGVDHRLTFRIGINLGDVIVEGDDIHGDGVNIADRLQGLAEPGGIAISGTAYDQVQDKLAVGYADLGEQQVKSIAKPIRAYRVLIDPDAVGKIIHAAEKRSRSWHWPALAVAVLLALAGTAAWLRPWEPRIEAASVERMALPLPDKPSLVVLPFANMSDDPKQDYFADGMTDDLITELSKVSGLFVIARNSSFTYKGKPVKIAQVAEELGVRYVLEGSVQRAGDRVRINAQLIDALNGSNVWADRFDGSLADIFALQDEVTRSSANALAIRLTSPQEASIVQKETSVPLAYDAFLRGWDHYRRTTPEDYAKAVPHFEKAISLDPEYNRAYAALAIVYVRSFGRGWSSSLGLSAFEALARGRQYLRKAMEKPSALARQAAGYNLVAGRLFKQALVEFKEAIALDPGDSWSYAFAAFALTSDGRADEAMSFIRTAMRLDPHPPPLFLYYLGVTQLGLGQFEDAASNLESAARFNPDDQFTFTALATTYAHLGRKQDAAAAINRYNELEVAQGGVPLTLSDCSFCGPVENRPYLKLEAGLRLAGVPENLSRSEFAEQNRLPAHEVRARLFGHRLHGFSRRTGIERSASLTKDGVAAMSGDWVRGIFPLTGGVARFEGNDLCLEFTAQTHCGPVLRNPGGTRVHENEFIWHTSEPFSFSIVE